MVHSKKVKVGLLLPGKKGDFTPETCRVANLFAEFEKHNFSTKLLLYSDETVHEVEEEAQSLNLIMIWVNPIHKGRDRSVLDAMLTRVADAGVYVSTHPKTILKMGTKEVLYDTKNMPWGSDTHIYKTISEYHNEFPITIKQSTRVLKQYRGSGGDGVWKIKLVDPDSQQVAVLHAKRGSMVEIMELQNFLKKMDQYFIGSGHLIDQEFQSRLEEGMIRCYMSLNKVIGFGHQFVTALVTPPGDEPLTPPPRYYYSKTKSEFQDLKQLLENQWISELQEELKIDLYSLPLLWDANFLLGPKDKYGKDTYVLCEINVSSVYPYPEQGNPDIVEQVKKMQSIKLTDTNNSI